MGKNTKQQQPDSFQEFMKKSGLLLYLAYKKYTICQHMRESKDWAIHGNTFLEFTMHLYFQYAIIDIWKLVSPSKNDRYTFKKLTKTYRQNIGEEKAARIEAIFENIDTDINVLHPLRNEIYAHSAMSEKATMPFYMTNIASLENVINGCTEIYTMLGGLGLDEDDFLHDLQKIIDLLGEYDGYTKEMNIRDPIKF